MSIPPYPLHWPDTMPRTPRKASSRFKTQLSTARNNVLGSLRLFASDSGKSVSDVVVSSNVTLGVDAPADTGVAVWFTWDGMQVSIAVDRYPKVQDNLQAIHRIIEGRREELRHGGLHIVRATFKGFQALPGPGTKRTWREVFGLAPNVAPPLSEIERLYRTLSKQRHPDVDSGSVAAMAELNVAFDEAKREMD